MYVTLAVAIGGSLGALLRYGAQRGLQAYVPGFPLGTLLANLVGAFLIGVLYPQLDAMPPWARPFFAAGFLGALTTLSSLKLEIILLLEEQKFLAAFSHWATGAFVCLLACWVGLLVGRLAGAS